MALSLSYLGSRKSVNIVIDDVGFMTACYFTYRMVNKWMFSVYNGNPGQLICRLTRIRGLYFVQGAETADDCRRSGPGTTLREFVV